MDGARLRASITVCWGDTVIAHRRLADGEDAILGDDPAALAPVPCDSLGLTAVCVATLREVPPSSAEKGAPIVLVPAGAVAFHACAGGPPTSVEGPAEIALADGETASLQIGAFLITVTAEEEPRRSWAARSRLGALRRPAAGVAFAALIHALALATASQSPSDEGPEAEAANHQAMARYLAAAESRAAANEAASEAAVADDQGTSKSRHVSRQDGNGQAAGGARAAAKQGTMGHGASRSTAPGRYAVARGEIRDFPAGGSRLEALLDARNFGMVGLLSETPRIPLTSFGQGSSPGLDRLDARGDLWGTSIGETFGSGGLGLSGIGDGGGGRYVGIGLGSVGTGHGFGHSLGTGGLGLARDSWGDRPWHGQYDGSICGSGYGPNRCTVRTTHLVRIGAPSVRVMRADTAALQVTSDGIGRTARTAIGAFRSCYAGTVTWDATAQDFVGHTGTVITRFVVLESGAVMSAATASSTLPLPEVAACVARVFQRLTFPARPDGGAAGVSVPVTFGVFHSRS